jgi:hypothetical protein
VYKPLPPGVYPITVDKYINMNNWRKFGALKASPVTFVERNITSNIHSATDFCNQLTKLTDNISNVAVF